MNWILHETKWLEPSHPASCLLKHLVLLLKVMHAYTYQKHRTKIISIIQNASAAHPWDEGKAAACSCKRAGEKSSSCARKENKAAQFALHSTHSFNQVIEPDSKKCQSECVIMCQRRVIIGRMISAFGLMSPSAAECEDEPKFLKMGQICVTGETKTCFTTDKIFKNGWIKDKTPSLTQLGPIWSLMRELFNLFAAAHCTFLALLFKLFSVWLTSEFYKVKKLGTIYTFSFQTRQIRPY